MWNIELTDQCGTISSATLADLSSVGEWLRWQAVDAGYPFDTLSAAVETFARTGWRINIALTHPVDLYV